MGGVQLFTLMLSLLISVAIGGYVFVYRHKAGAKPMIFISLFIMFWNLVTIFEYSVIDHDSKLLWRNLAQISGFMLPYVIFYFTLDFTETKNKKPFLALMVLPLIAITLIFTNPWHHWVRSGTYINSDTGHLVVDVTLLGLMIVLLNMAFILLGVIVLLNHLRQTTGKHRKQTIVIILVMVFNVVLTIANLTVFDVIGLRVLTSSLYTPSLILFFYALFKYDFFVVSPLTKDRLLMVIDHLVIVVNPKGEVVEWNPAAFEHFADDQQKTLREGMMVNALFHEPLQIPLKTNSHTQEIVHKDALGKRTFELHFHPLFTKQLYSGMLLLIEDITSKKSYEQLLKMRADYDALTQLLNRTAFQKAFDKLSGQSYIMLMLDIDDFKAVNDMYGHAAGDEILANIANILKRVIPLHCLSGRLGGEEFAGAGIDIDQATALTTAETLRKEIETFPFNINGAKIHVTASIGVAHTTFKSGFDKLRHQADIAMYQAKEKGKNTVCLYKD